MPFSLEHEKGYRGGYEIRTREAVTPTRFPSVRHRPLGESSSCTCKLLQARKATITQTQEKRYTVIPSARLCRTVILSRL